MALGFVPTLEWTEFEKPCEVPRMGPDRAGSSLGQTRGQVVHAAGSSFDTSQLCDHGQITSAFGALSVKCEAHRTNPGT